MVTEEFHLRVELVAIRHESCPDEQFEKLLHYQRPGIFTDNIRSRGLFFVESARRATESDVETLILEGEILVDETMKNTIVATRKLNLVMGMDHIADCKVVTAELHD